MFGATQQNKDEALCKLVGGPTLNLQKLEKLLAKGANPNARDEFGNPVLCLAMRNGAEDEDAVQVGRILLEAGADINAADLNDATPLIAALKRPNVPAAKMLIRQNADIHALGPYGDTALYFALNSTVTVGSGLPEMLIKRGALTQPDNGQHLRALRTGIVFGAKEDTLAGLLAVVKDVNSTEDGAPPLFLAISNYNKNKSLDILLAHEDINVNIVHENVSALCHAIKCRNDEAVERLIAAGAKLDITADGAQPLFVAVEHKQRRIIEVLIAAGVDVNARNAKGCTPLMQAARTDIGIMEALVLAGARIEATDNKNQTAVDHAREAGARDTRRWAEQLYLRQELEKKAVEAKKAAVSDNRFTKLSDVEIEIRHGKGLSMVFNFWTEQVVYRDPDGKLPSTICNFDAVQRQEAIDEARQKLKELDGNPPEPQSGLDKAKGLGLKS